MTLSGILASVIVYTLPAGFPLGSSGYTCGGEVGGVYVNETIYVCQIDDDYEFYRLHEIGHYIEDKHLTDEQ